MKKREKYLNIKSSFVKIIFVVMLIFILASIGLTISLYGFYGKYIKERVKTTNQIIFGVNTGILCSMLITLAVVCPIVLYASRKMASPLVEMKKVAIAMSKGNFLVRAKDNYSGEMGQLAVTLNQLAAELSKTISSLTIEGDLLRQILNSMSDGLLGFDLEQQVNLKNTTFEKMFGNEVNLEKLENGLYEIIHKISLAAIKNQKTEIITCSFKEKSILISGSPIRSDDNSIVGTVLLFRDVTEAERLEQTRKDYVANVSHELKSPLTAVKALIIPLKEGMVKDDKKKNHFYEIIYNEEDIVIIKSPVGLPGRAIRNKFIEDVKDNLKKPFKCTYKCIKTCDYKKSPYCIAIALMNAKKGNLKDGFAFAGQNAYRITKLMSVNKLIESLKVEFASVPK